MENFFGNWSIRVTEKNAAFNQRFLITGSTSSDGIYNGLVGFTLPSVSGDNWQILLEWNDGVSSSWLPSGVRKNLIYDLEKGLMVILGADDNVEGSRDGDFDDLILTCQNLQPELNPLSPASNPYDFTFPQKLLTEKKKGKKQ